MRCQNCKIEINGTPKFCPKCGTKMEVRTPQSDGTKKCPQCGTENALAAKFCKKDGYRFDSVAVKPEMAAASTAPTSVMLGSSEPIAPEGVAKQIPPADDLVICPKCGTPNLSGAKFCKKDGYALQAGVAIPQATPVPKSAPIKQPAPAQSAGGGPAVENKSHKGLVIGVLIGVVLLASAGGGYAYWTGYIGNRQESVQNEINAELGSHGLSNIKVRVNDDWVASLSGTVPNQTSKDQAFGLVSRHKALKSIVNDVQIQLNTTDVEKNLNKALTEAGFSSVPTVQIDKDWLATLRGSANDQPEKDRMLALVTRVAGIKGVRDEIEVAPETIPEPVNPDLAEVAQVPSPPPLLAVPQTAPQDVAARTALSKELNDRLRANGVSGVTGHVNPDMSVALSGTVRSADERYRALTIGGSLTGANGVHENIQIVSPQIVKLAPPKTPQESTAIDPAKLEGDINRSLRSRDINSINAQVNDDMSLTLKGSASAGEKERAMQYARQVRGIRGIKDKIFVVE